MLDARPQQQPVSRFLIGLSGNESLASEGARPAEEPQWP